MPMSDEPTVSGWLPPSAPGAQPPPRFEARPPAPPEEEPPAEEAKEHGEPEERLWAPPPPEAERSAPPGWAPPSSPSRFQAGRAYQDTPAPAPGPPRPTFAGDRPRGAPNRLAVAALVLGIAGIALLVLSLGLSFIFSIPLTGAAWVCAHQARTRLRLGREVSGAGQVKAGLILGIGGTVLGIAAMIVWIVLIAQGLSIEEFREDLERELERQRARDSRAALESIRAAIATLPPWR
jgi:hypothetical protein